MGVKGFAASDGDMLLPLDYYYDTLRRVSVGLERSLYIVLRN